jgi:hypothetical protein
MEKTLTNLRKDAQGSRGSLELPEKHVNLIPGYSCAWISTLADFHRHSGDLEFLIGQKENLKTLLKYLEQDLDSNNIFANKNKGTNFVDWSPGLSKDSPETRRGTHFFLTKAFREAGFLFDELGDHFSAKNYWNFADELAVAGRGYFFEPDAKTFGLRRQVNAMAILSGTSLDSDGESIFEKILKPLSPAWADMATPYYNYYVLEAMAQLGHYESALSVIRTYWGEMLDLGATSFWEAYDSSWPKTNFHRHLKADDGEGTFVSLNHGWSAGPTVWLTENVLGIKPKSGGFSLTEISPHLEDLEWASGSVPTPHGLIEIKIAKNPGGLKMNLSLPSGIRAHIKLPGSQIWVNGEPVVGQKMGGEILFELANSGTYEISSSRF